MNIRLIVTVLFISIFKFGYAQYAGCSYTQPAYTQFMKTTTLFVLQNNAEFDSALKKAVVENWTLTKYEFIDAKNVANYISNNNYSLFLPITIKTIHTSTSSTGVSNEYTVAEDYYALISGGKKKLSDYDAGDLLAYALFDTYGIEGNKLACAYRLPNLLNEVQQAYLAVGELKIKKGDPSAVRGNLIEHYAAKAAMLSKKTLLINKAYLANIDEADLSRVYTFPYKIVSQEEITTAIETKNSSVVYLLPVFSNRKNIFVVNPTDGKIIYADYQGMGTELKKSDMKDLNKVIEKSSSRK